MVLIPLTLCTRACVIILLLCSACHLVLMVELQHTFRVSMGVTLLVSFSGGAAALRPNYLCSPPPIQKSTIEIALREFPSMLKWVVPGRNGMVQIKCVYTIFPMKMVYRHDIKWRQIHRPTHASGMLSRLFFHGNWFHIAHVLHLSGAGWSGLPLWHVDCCVWCCHPRWLWVSLLNVYR